MLRTLRDHWPEYLIEAWCLATFMVSACFFGSALFYPASPLACLSPELRGIIMGLAMGGTAVCIIRSQWGKRSGAHFNPAVTVAFLRAGKIARADAAFYVVAQFAGAAAGVLLARIVLGPALADDAVNFVTTVPGSSGGGIAFAAEFAISFAMMTTILHTANSVRTAHMTPYIAGSLVAFFIVFEGPYSGMSMNPARTFGSAVVSGVWKGWWVYFTAPPAAMLAAAELFIRSRGIKAIRCAKLDHSGTGRCIFRCAFGADAAAAARPRLAVPAEPRNF